MNVDYSSGYICLTCYRDVGKYAFLKSGLQKLRDELMAKLTANLTAHCSQAAASIETAEQRHCVTKRRAPVAERPSVKVSSEYCAGINSALYVAFNFTTGDRHT